MEKNFQKAINVLNQNGKFYIDKDAELVYEKCNEAVKGLI